MLDLTRGAIFPLLVKVAIPIAIGTIFQTLYYLVDLYFVSLLGGIALAGLNTAGNIVLLTLAISQVLSTGALSLVAQAVGRNDREQANFVFNQAFGMAVICAVLTLTLGYMLTNVYLNLVVLDRSTFNAAHAYLYWFLPGVAMQFIITVFGAGHRGTGTVKPIAVIQIVTVLINIILAPILINGFGTRVAVGVAGAGFASTISIAVGLLMISVYFLRYEIYLKCNIKSMLPHFNMWKRLLVIGLPAGIELLLIFISMGVIYWTIRSFGPAAQAGYGVGARIVQSIFLPIIAITFAMSPIVGQNFGARRNERVTKVFWITVWLITILMSILVWLVNAHPTLLVRPFAGGMEVELIAIEYVRIISWGFVAQGLVFTASGFFQGLGDTRPGMWSSVLLFLTFALPGIYLSYMPNFELHQLWFLSVISVGLRAALNFLFLYHRFSNSAVKR